MSEHPFFFTWSSQRGAKALELTGGEGAHFTTADGTRWLDLASFSYQVNAGHGERRIIDAIKRQADTLCVSTPNAAFFAKTELAKRLLALAPVGYDRVFFTLGGAEANENAVKIARLATGRNKLISRYRSYHGATMGALSLTGDWRRPPLEPGIPGVVHAMDCYCDRCPFGQRVDSCKRECAIHIGDLLALEGPGTVAAVVLEPVPGANGVLVPPPDYWPMVRAACDLDGALLIADEVLTGFGRTGRCFGIDHYPDVVPDMITVAKGLTSGYAPMGAVLVHERISRHFDDNLLVAGLTSYAHPLGCAAALATLDVYRDDGLFDRAAALESVLLDGLRDIPATRAVRGQGLLAAVEIDMPVGCWRLLAAALERRSVALHLYPRTGTIIMSPPLCISENELRDGIARLADALTEVRAGSKEGL